MTNKKAVSYFPFQENLETAFLFVPQTKTE